ncbi:unnamed protein product [Camellia sinensis]
MCHYVVICGYDAMTDEFEIRDPASSGKHEKVTSKRLEEARKSFGIDEDLLLWDLVTAGSLFNELSRTSLISWNAIIAGHVQNGLVEMGLSLYYKMRQSGLTPDQYTFASVFRACATLATLQQGKQAKYFVVCLCIISCLYPVDYEPPFFRSCSEQEAHNPWIKNPLEMEVGNVNSKHLVLALKCARSL